MRDLTERNVRTVAYNKLYYYLVWMRSEPQCSLDLAYKLLRNKLYGISRSRLVLRISLVWFKVSNTIDNIPFFFLGGPFLLNYISKWLWASFDGKLKTETTWH